MAKRAPRPSLAGRVRLALVLGVLALAFSLGGWWLWRDYRQFAAAPLLPPGKRLTVELPPGAGLAGLLTRLEMAGVSVGRPAYWSVLARELGVERRLQAGEYAIGDRLSPRDLLFAIAEGRVVQHRLTLQEGWRFAQARAAIQGHPALRQTLLGLSDAEVLTRIGAVEPHPEGLLLAETYFFPKGYTDVELLKRAYYALHRALSEAWQQRDPRIPFQEPYQALILASIIEKETARADERRRIAGVFVRRLQLGMRLQTDPTVIYGLGAAFDGNLRRRDLEQDTPYNTYTRHGLPPTPIALVGIAALRAAVQPLPGEELYFVARGDGTHHFSATYAEHRRAVARYQLGRP